MNAMRYQIIKNYYAPMCGDWASQNVVSSHGILVRACNFHCEFCNFSFQDDKKYKCFNDDEFACAIIRLLPYGKRFKFSGGEPTLDRTLSDKISFVKQCNGFVFLDTNGSRPTVVEKLLSEDLVDVIGISLKGINADQAITVSGATNQVVCWENPLYTISLATKYPKVRFIVTHVFNANSNAEELEKFSLLLPKQDNVYLKVNNLLFNRHHKDGMQRMENERLIDISHSFLKRNPFWRSRMILVNSQDAIFRYNSIIFL